MCKGFWGYEGESVIVNFADIRCEGGEKNYIVQTSNAIGEKNLHCADIKCYREKNLHCADIEGYGGV